MDEIGAYQAKTNLGQLLKRVERGEQIAITVKGKRVARLVPEPEAERTDIRDAVERLKTFARRHDIKEATVEELLAAKHEGHRY